MKVVPWKANNTDNVLVDDEIEQRPGEIGNFGTGFGTWPIP
jgi:hypothetical protein